MLTGILKLKPQFKQTKIFLKPTADSRRLLICQVLNDNDMLYFCFKDSIVIQIMSVPLVCHIVIIADNMLTRYMYEVAML